MVAAGQEQSCERPYTRFTEDLQGFTSGYAEPELNSPSALPQFLKTVSPLSDSWGAFELKRKTPIMRDRVSAATKSRSKPRTVTSWFSHPLRAVKQSKSSGDQNGAIASARAGVAKIVSPVTRRRRIRGLREEIYQLIECEAMRMSRVRISHRVSEAGEEIGQTFFSSAELILQRLERYAGLGSQERQFLMCAIQAVGFALGAESIRLDRTDRLRRRSRWVAGVLADAMERKELTLLQSDFFGPDLLNRLSGD